MAPGVEHDIDDPLFRDRAFSKPLYRFGDDAFHIKADVTAFGGTGNNRQALAFDLEDYFELGDDYDNLQNIALPKIKYKGGYGKTMTDDKILIKNRDRIKNLKMIYG